MSYHTTHYRLRPFSLSMFIALWTALFMCLAASTSMASSDYQPIEADKGKAISYVYFQIGEDAYPEGSLNFNTFTQHIETIETEGFHVTAPKDLFNTDKKAAPSLMLSFDTGHKSILTDAIPLLLERELPFTIFISPSEIDQKLPYVINWDQLRKLQRNDLVTIGIHSSIYKKMDTIHNRQAVETNIVSAIARYKEKLGAAPLYFAYPYGDHDEELEQFLKRNGIQAAFGLHSGVIHSKSNRYLLPRFTMTDNIGSNQRFLEAAYNLPLPQHDQIPKNTILEQAPNSISFSISKDLDKDLGSLLCFHSEIGKIKPEIIGTNRVHITLPETISESERVRINCTINAGYDEEFERQRWRWHGILHRITQSN